MAVVVLLLLLGGEVGPGKERCFSVLVMAEEQRAASIRPEISSRLIPV
jgi:hypothetical protein